MSPTGSKTGHPFLANGPRRSTRVGEPSRRPKVTHPESRFLGAVPAQRSRRSESACEMAFLSPFLFLSPSTSLSSAWFRIRSWSARPKFRSSQAVARICVNVSTTPTTYPGPFEPSEA